MGTVATLAVNVIANTGGMTKGFNKAKKESKSFGASFGASMKKMVTPAALATAAIAAVGVAVVKISSQLTRLDEIAKKSRALGISGQDLMEFQHAASLAGVEASAFTSALQKMQKNIGDAVGGLGTAKAALSLVGLEIGELAKMDATEQFLAIADKISQIENASERAAVATAIFGRAGADLIPMFVQGSAAIREHMDELKRLQGVISQYDLTQVEGAVDAMERLSKSWEGMWKQFAVEAAPVITDLVEGLTEILQLVKSIGSWFPAWTKYLIPVYGLLRAIKDTWDWITDADLKRSIAQGIVEDAKEREKVLLADAEEVLKVQKEAVKAREALEAKGASLMESLRTPMEMYTDTIANLNMMLGEGVINWETYGRAVAKAQEDIKKSDEFAAKEIRVAERQSVGAAIRGQSGTYSIQLKQQRALERIREEEKLQLKQLKQQTSLLQQLNNNVQTGTVVTI